MKNDFLLFFRQGSTSKKNIIKLNKEEKMDKIKVLMIDDNVNLIEMVKEYFKDKNIEIFYRFMI